MQLYRVLSITLEHIAHVANVDPPALSSANLMLFLLLNGADSKSCGTMVVLKAGTNSGTRDAMGLFEALSVSSIEKP